MDVTLSHRQQLEILWTACTHKGWMRHPSFVAPARGQVHQQVLLDLCVKLQRLTAPIHSRLQQLRWGHARLNEYRKKGQLQDPAPQH